MENSPKNTFNDYKCPHCRERVCGIFAPIVDHARTQPKLIGQFGEIIPEIADKYRIENLGFFEPMRCIVTVCPRCHQPSFWIRGELKYPTPVGEEPIEGMPAIAEKLFREAQRIIPLSPRAACALLRVCLEINVNRILDLAGVSYTSKNLYQRICLLPIDERIKKMFHTCRSVGNKNAHPGDVDLSDEETQESAVRLSDLINFLASRFLKPHFDNQRLVEMYGLEEH